MVEFQWFLMALSVRPGRNLAMIAQRLPRLRQRSVQAVRLHDRDVFFLGPALFLDVGVQVVVPALAALLADAAGQLLRDERPVLRPVVPDHLLHQLVLILRPGPLHQARVQHLLPAVQALHVGAVAEKACDLLPVARLLTTKLPRTCSPGPAASHLPPASTTSLSGSSSGTSRPSPGPASLAGSSQVFRPAAAGLRFDREISRSISTNFGCLQILRVRENCAQARWLEPVRFLRVLACGFSQSELSLDVRFKRINFWVGKREDSFPGLPGLVACAVWRCLEVVDFGFAPHPLFREICSRGFVECSRFQKVGVRLG